eukprot:TRINITY_DN23104_c0_g1_i1.p1 TRINITY_DN23104_c0_g1~~TRINITY_DN23104_c0_g1_i1.p1  ORF type:complete len:983 (-),score=191.75 TRINITY_DN23104_c0_g1_i1:192-3140(-)
MSLDKQLLEACTKRCNNAKIIYFELVTLYMPQFLVPKAASRALKNGTKSLANQNAGKEASGMDLTFGLRQAAENAAENVAEALGDGVNALDDITSLTFGKPRKTYLCVGVSSIFLLKSSLAGLISGGQIDYAWIEKVVVDSVGSSRLMVKLNANSSFGQPQKFLVDSEYRDRLLSTIAEKFLVYKLLEKNKIINLPRELEDLGAPQEPGKVVPFKGFKLEKFKDYSFFLRFDFVEEPSSIATTNTGTYAAPIGILQGSKSFMGGVADYFKGAKREQDPQLKLMLNVCEPLLWSDLQPLGRDHVRWVALECKQNLLESWDSIVLRNQPYQKKMNLANDTASWVGWELAIQNKTFTWAVVVLRRQYMPPLLDTVQDFALAMKFPTEEDPSSQKLKVGKVQRELYMIADSLSPTTLHPSIYVELAQAKLDALQFDEDGYEWILGNLGLLPNEGNVRVEKFAKVFVKGVVKLLYDEHVMCSKQPLVKAEELVDAACEKLFERDIEPMTVVLKFLAHPGEGLPKNAGDSGRDNGTEVGPDAISGTDAAAHLHAWQFRVAIYLGARLDGALLGAMLTLADVIAGVHHGAVSLEARQVLSNILCFLLHARPSDLRLPWQPRAMTVQLDSLGLLVERKRDEKVQCMFNNRVMQALLETGHLRNELRDDPLGKVTEMSMAYVHLLSNLMHCDFASVNLKAAICRMLVTDKDIGARGQARVLCDGCMALFRGGSVFLATYACAALVNLAQSHDPVKGHLISTGVVDACIHALKSKDGDLMLYTLMLLVHLTKRSHNRTVLQQLGCDKLVHELFLHSYKHVPRLRRLLSELLSVIGQFCNQKDIRKYFIDDKLDFLSKVLELVDSALKMDRVSGGDLPETSMKVLAKAYFCLKQLAGNSTNMKEVIVSRVVGPLVQDLKSPANCQNQDYASNAITLLCALAPSANKKLHDAGWPEAYRTLISSSLSSIDVMRERIEYLSKVSLKAIQRKSSEG